MCASVMIIDDDIIESNETFRVKLQEDYNDQAVLIGTISSAVVTIIDDDKRKSLKIKPVFELILSIMLIPFLQFLCQQH